MAGFAFLFFLNAGRAGGALEATLHIVLAAHVASHTTAADAAFHAAFGAEMFGAFELFVVFALLAFHAVISLLLAVVTNAG
jgi:hypothetical protein